MVSDYVPDPIDELVSEIEARNVDEHSLDGLSEPEADLLATATSHGIVGNGGFRHWYEGKTLADTRRAADAFDRLGLADAAAAMRASMEHIPAAFDTWDLATRQRWYPDGDRALDEAFGRLSRVLWGVDWEAAARRYALARAADLLAAWPGYAPYLQALA